MESIASDLSISISAGDIAQSNVVTIPPWLHAAPVVSLELATFNKETTNDFCYKSLFLSHRQKYGDYIPIYTDGSKSATHVGCAFFCCGTETSENLPLLCSVFTAELRAILLALLHVSHSNHSRCIIYSDSQAALKALLNARLLHHPIILCIHRQLHALRSKCHDIRFYWVPGHVGIPGNEIADAAAKSACCRPLIHIPIPPSDLRPLIRSRIHQQWQADWDSQSSNKLHSLKPLISSHPWCSGLRRWFDVIFTRIRIGHSRLTHLHLLKGEPAPLCSDCGDALTIAHLFTCLRHAHHRMLFFNSSVIDSSDVLTSSFHRDALLRYLHALGVMSDI